ncbi:MAG: hypothetical protein Q4F57_05600 [Weeksellaceae bacterium]|nr:hypothetical protein [Weeksellaceae bacterium]
MQINSVIYIAGSWQDSVYFFYFGGSIPVPEDLHRYRPGPFALSCLPVASKPIASGTLSRMSRDPVPESNGFAQQQSAQGYRSGPCRVSAYAEGNTYTMGMHT